MELTHHMRLDLSREKALHIFSQVDRDQTNELSLSEFAEAVEFVELEVAKKALELMGLSKSTLLSGAAASVGTLLVLLGFVLVGSSVFADGGTFSSVVSAMLPLSAGAGMSSSAEGETEGGTTVKDRVEEALEIVRS